MDYDATIIHADGTSDLVMYRGEPLALPTVSGHWMMLSLRLMNWHRHLAAWALQKEDGLMKKYAWVLVFSYTFNGGWTVIDNIASKESCEALKVEIDAPKGKCIQYEVASAQNSN